MKPKMMIFARADDVVIFGGYPRSAKLSQNRWKSMVLSSHVSDIWEGVQKDGVMINE